MANNDVVIGSAIAGLIGGVGAALWLLRVARYTNPSVGPEPDKKTFRYGTTARLFGITVGLGFPFAVVVLMIVFPPEDFEIVATLGCLGLSMLPFLVFWETNRFRVVLSDSGLKCRSPWRGTRSLNWNEIDRLTISSLSKSFVFHANDGYKFRVPVWVNGVRMLLKECERHLPKVALEEAHAHFVNVRKLFYGRRKRI